MGAEYIDYVIADRIVIPLEDASFFSEKIVLMPDTYWATDQSLRYRKGTNAQRSWATRQRVRLLLFHNSYKITPAVFDCWMRILKRVDGSVLWLFEANAKATKQFERNEALARGVNPERLVFAKRMPLSDHLARLCLADLSLDTLPYNAHTTTSDALWGGLPVFTRVGETFAGRAAASLLNAIGLPELLQQH